jgi:hypothetical protein
MTANKFHLDLLYLDFAPSVRLRCLLLAVDFPQDGDSQIQILIVLTGAFYKITTWLKQPPKLEVLFVINLV